uniref:DUF6463 family protein n=1 Tax=Streptomyces sp. NBC_00049 TaxID=2903617 RepID=A0AAU2JI22_9ACTN
MSIGTDSAVTVPADVTRARTLITWAGRSIVVIGAVHIALFTVKTWSRWGDWLGGELRGVAAVEDPANAASLADFWAFLGGFAVPLIVLGLVLIRMARTGHEPPRYLGWTLGAWVLVSAWVLEPSGFLLGLVPTVLLLLAQRGSAKPVRH